VAFDLEFSLKYPTETVWLVSTMEKAQRVLREKPTEWYNARYETPGWSSTMKKTYKDFEVFEVEI